MTGFPPMIPPCLENLRNFSYRQRQFIRNKTEVFWRKRFGFLVSASRGSRNIVLKIYTHFFYFVKVDCLIELPFRLDFFLYSLRNRKIAEIIQSQDHHAFAALQRRLFSIQFFKYTIRQFVSN